MVAGHLQTKKGYYYIVLNLKSEDGRRKPKWIPTKIPVAGKKSLKQAEELLAKTRCTYEDTVVQCICDGESKIIEKDRTKNKSSCRSMPLVPQYRELLLRMKERQENCRKLCGNSYTDTGYIFVNDMGVPYKPNYVTQHFKIILRMKGKE